MLIDLKNMLLMLFAMSLILVTLAMDTSSGYKENIRKLDLNQNVNRTIVVKLH